EWLVPGMLKEKTQQLLKSLPQKLRRHCVPLPEYAAGFYDRVEAARSFGRGGLLDALIADIREQKTLMVKAADFKLETLPAHLFMTFKVIDEHGRQLDMGRKLATLQAELGGQARASFQRIAEQAVVTADESLAQPRAQAQGNGKATEAAASDAAISEYQNLTSWSFGEL